MGLDPFHATHRLQEVLLACSLRQKSLLKEWVRDACWAANVENKRILSAF